MIDQLTLLYLVFGVRWAFYGRGCLEVTLDFVAMCGGLIALMTAVGWLFKTGDEYAELGRTRPDCERLVKTAACHIID